MPQEQKDFAIEFIDAGEMSQENYESLIEMLMEWMERDLYNQQSQENAGNEIG